MPASEELAKYASEVQVGDRCKLGCQWVTVARVEPQTRGPLKGQIALASRDGFTHFFKAHDQVRVRMLVQS